MESQPHSWSWVPTGRQWASWPARLILLIPGVELAHEQQAGAAMLQHEAHGLGGFGGEYGNRCATWPSRWPPGHEKWAQFWTKWQMSAPGSKFCAFRWLPCGALGPWFVARCSPAPGHHPSVASKHPIRQFGFMVEHNRESTFAWPLGLLMIGVHRIPQASPNVLPDKRQCDRVTLIFIAPPVPCFDFSSIRRNSTRSRFDDVVRSTPSFRPRTGQRAMAACVAETLAAADLGEHTTKGAPLPSSRQEPALASPPHTQYPPLPWHWSAKRGSSFPRPPWRCKSS